MKRPSPTFLFIVSVLFPLQSALHAQFTPTDDDPSSTGLFIAVRGLIAPGLDVHRQAYTTMGADTTVVERLDGGGGFGIDIGWGITNWLTLTGGFDLASHDINGPRYNGAFISYFEFTARVQVPLETFSPYAKLSYGTRGFSMRKSSQSGNVITIYNEFEDVEAGYLSYGGGIRIFIVDVSYMVSSTAYPEAGVAEFTTDRFQLGISFWFQL